MKKGGVGLYIKDSLPSKSRSGLVTLPECIVHEIHLNKKSTFSQLFIEVQDKMRLNLITL